MRETNVMLVVDSENTVPSSSQTPEKIRLCSGEDERKSDRLYQ